MTLASCLPPQALILMIQGGTVGRGGVPGVHHPVVGAAAFEALRKGV